MLKDKFTFIECSERYLTRNNIILAKKNKTHKHSYIPTIMGVSTL